MSSSSLSASSAYRLRSRHGGREIQQQQQQKQQKPISNESNDLLEIAYADMMNGYKYEYVCQRIIQNLANVTALQVYFDYEFAVSAAAKGLEEGKPKALPAMEWAVLWTVAERLHLHGCNLHAQEIPSYNTTTTTTTNDRRLMELEEGRDYIVALSSLETDEMDTSAVDGCEFLTDVSVDQECYPMRGVMTAKYAGTSNPEAVEQYLLSLIEDEINAQNVLTGGITETRFLGNRADMPPPVSATRENDNNRSLNVGLVSGVAAAAACLVIVSALLLMRRRRNNKSSSDHKDKELEKELEAAIGQSQLDLPDATDIEKNETKSSSHDEELPSVLSAESAAASIALSVASSKTLLMSNVSEKQNEDEGLVKITETLTDAASETSSSDSASEASDAAVIGVPTVPTVIPPIASSSSSEGVKPPKPPKGPSKQPPASASTTMKRRRRRKKKKKKRKLTKVSSRENIKEMETIAEAEDEESSRSDDEDGWSGSEYSWSGSESDGHSSRDPSPEPSPNRTSAIV